MKYLLFGYDDYYPSSNNLIAVSDCKEKIISYAQLHKYSTVSNYDNYEVFECLDGVGLKLIWSKDGSPPGKVVKVEFL